MVMCMMLARMRKGLSEEIEEGLNLLLEEKS